MVQYSGGSAATKRVPRARFNINPIWGRRSGSRAGDEPQPRRFYGAQTQRCGEALLPRRPVSRETFRHMWTSRPLARHSVTLTFHSLGWKRSRSVAATTLASGSSLTSVVKKWTPYSSSGRRLRDTVILKWLCVCPFLLRFAIGAGCAPRWVGVPSPDLFLSYHRRSASSIASSA